MMIETEILPMDETDETSTARFATETQTIPELPGANLLGKGYDVFGFYASPNSTTTQLFNLPQETALVSVGNYSYKVPNLVLAHWLGEEAKSILFGHHIEEFQKTFSAKAGLSGKAGFFSASIQAEFSSAVVRKSEWQFVLLEDSVHSCSIELPALGQLRQYLRTDVRQDLLNAEPRDLFTRYGTHFVRKAIVGGRCEFWCYVSQSKKYTKEQIEAQVKAGYTRLTGSIGFEAGAGGTSDYQTFSKTFNASLRVKGGQSDKRGELSNASKPDRFAHWAASVDSAPALVDFTSDSLTGIWELCENKARRDALKHYYETTILAEHPPITPVATELELEGKYIGDMKSVVTDKGSGADRNLEFFAPDLSKLSDFKSLGHYAQGGRHYIYGSQPFGNVLVVKETEVGRERKALKEPLAFALVWDDRGSGADDDINIWRPIPPDNYVALGFVVTRGDRKKQPPKSSAHCVRKDLVSQAGFGNLIWNDKGSGANRDLSLYAVVPNDVYGKPTGLFWAQANYGPASGAAWCPLGTILKTS